MICFSIQYFSPAFYWIFTYLFDLITSVIWFCYILAIFCIFDVAFNGSPSSRPTSGSSASIEIATPWDLRMQFYPLTIIIALPTLPFVYLLTKLFKSDVLVGFLIVFFANHCCSFLSVDYQCYSSWLLFILLV